MHNPITQDCEDDIEFDDMHVFMIADLVITGLFHYNLDMIFDFEEDPYKPYFSYCIGEYSEDSD